MGSFLKSVLGLLWVFAESLEVTSLKRKLEKQTKANKDLEEIKKQLEEDIDHLRSELQQCFSDKNSIEEDLRYEIGLTKRSLETALENNRALLEKQERLELESAKQKATLEIRQYEKDLMASLVKFHKEQVNASIALTADSYAGDKRSQRGSE